MWRSLYRLSQKKSSAMLHFFLEQTVRTVSHVVNCLRKRILQMWCGSINIGDYLKSFLFFSLSGTHGRLTPFSSHHVSSASSLSSSSSSLCRPSPPRTTAGALASPTATPAPTCPRTTPTPSTGTTAPASSGTPPTTGPSTTGTGAGGTYPTGLLNLRAKHVMEKMKAIGYSNLHYVHIFLWTHSVPDQHTVLDAPCIAGHIMHGIGRDRSNGHIAHLQVCGNCSGTEHNMTS